MRLLSERIRHEIIIAVDSLNRFATGDVKRAHLIIKTFVIFCRGVRSNWSQHHQKDDGLDIPSSHGYFLISAITGMVRLNLLGTSKSTTTFCENALGAVVGLRRILTPCCIS